MSNFTVPPKHNSNKKGPNHERWMISYADLLTLLLALFIVLYASSTRNKHLTDMEANGMLRAFHGTPIPIMESPSGDRGVMKNHPSPVPKPVQAPASADSQVPKNLIHQMAVEMKALQAINAQLATVLKPLEQAHEVTVSSQPLTLTIQLNASVLFKSGQATLVPDAVTLLSKIASSMTTMPQPFEIIVQGYTDNQPISSAQFSSNWSLSSERADKVIELFQGVGVNGGQMSAQGFGEFQPIAPNSDDDGRTQNRRVVIVIHAPDPSDSASAANAQTIERSVQAQVAGTSTAKLSTNDAAPVGGNATAGQ